MGVSISKIADKINRRAKPKRGKRKGRTIGSGKYLFAPFIIAYKRL